MINMLSGMQVRWSVHGSVNQANARQEKQDNDSGSGKAQNLTNVSISDEARAKLKEVRAESNETKNFADKVEVIRQLREANKQAEAAAGAFDSLRRLLIIAMRIMRGDNVPHQDHRFLAENDPELYAKAMSLRITKEDPEDHDRLSEDEDFALEVSGGREMGRAPDIQPASTQVEGGEMSPA